jgi:hypothetical protein
MVISSELRNKSNRAVVRNHSRLQKKAPTVTVGGWSPLKHVVFETYFERFSCLQQSGKGLFAVLSTLLFAVL